MREGNGQYFFLTFLKVRERVCVCSSAFRRGEGCGGGSRGGREGLLLALSHLMINQASHSRQIKHAGWGGGEAMKEGGWVCSFIARLELFDHHPHITFETDIGGEGE